MSYSPTLGRFLERDPIGYDDGMNPYEFVHGNPVGLVDPMGLAAEDGKFEGVGGSTVINIDGKPVQIGVQTMKAGNNEYIGIISRASKDAKEKYPCEKLEWIQFVYRIVENPDKNVKYQFKNKNGDIYDATTDPANPIRRTDNNIKGSPISTKEYKGAQRKPDIHQMTFVDAPTFPVTGKAEKAIYDAFLLADGKIVYHVHWERHKTIAGDATYENVSGDPASELPTWAKDTLKKDGFKDPTAPEK
jgi:uncharacterized protein RhaS with RHS repeats